MPHYQHGGHRREPHTRDRAVLTCGPARRRRPACASKPVAINIAGRNLIGSVQTVLPAAPGAAKPGSRALPTIRAAAEEASQRSSPLSGIHKLRPADERRGVLHRRVAGMEFASAMTSRVHLAAVCAMASVMAVGAEMPGE